MPRSMKERPVASIVLPTYNERDNIAPLIRSIDASMNIPCEFIVVDDASPDGTGDIVEALARELDHVRLIARHERGLTSAIQRGIDESRGEVVVWMDCDFSMPPELVPQLIAQVVDGEKDAAIGSRYVAGGATSKEREGWLVAAQRLLTRRLNRGITALLGTDFHDWTSGFIAVRSSTIKSVRLQGDYGEYFIGMMAELIRGGARFVEIPFRVAPRRSGESKTASGPLRLAGLGLNYLRAFAAARRVLGRKRGRR